MPKVQAIVRGPEDFFDGQVLCPAGSVVEVDEAFVSTEDYFEVETEVRLKDPVIDKDGKVHRMVTEKLRKRVMFRPLSGVEAAVSSATEAAIAQPDRLNVSDMLKGGVADIVAKIASGQVDDFLDAIAHAESSGKQRKMVADAISERMNKA